MIMVSFPFDSKITGYDSDNYPIYDRAVDSSTLTTMISEFVSTGVFPKEEDGFTVTAGDGMTVNVSPGSAMINGTTCIEKDARTLTIQAADSTYDRIDSVILRYDNNENVRAIDLYVLKGTAASAPVQPTLTRDGTIFEIALANIYIPVNSITISNERITDTRGDISRCGWATGISQDFVESLDNRFALVNNSLASVNESIANIPVLKTITKTYSLSSSMSLLAISRKTNNDNYSYGVYFGRYDVTKENFGGLSADDIFGKTININLSDIILDTTILNDTSSQVQTCFCKFFKNSSGNIYYELTVLSYGKERQYIKGFKTTLYYF